MRHALALKCACAGGALALVVACSHAYEPDMQPRPGEGYVVQTTGAVVGFDQASTSDQPDLSLEEAASRMAGQICANEVACHADARDPKTIDRCVTAYHDRARAELGRWRCSPAASRARSKDCIATIRTEPCGFDFGRQRRLCEGNDDCPNPDARLIAPGAALADAGL